MNGWMEFLNIDFNAVLIYAWSEFKFKLKHEKKNQAPRLLKEMEYQYWNSISIYEWTSLAFGAVPIYYLSNYANARLIGQSP